MRSFATLRMTEVEIAGQARNDGIGQAYNDSKIITNYALN